jgi:rhodanese-related sulfurtransferase
MSLKHLLIILSLFIPCYSYAVELHNLNPNEVQESALKNALIIDIRTPREWQQTGVIPGSHLVTFFDKNGKYDAEKWLAKVKSLQSSPDQHIILVCRSGTRSGRVGNFLTQKLNMSNVSHLANGISAWLREKRPTETACTATKTC